ncbi:MAG: hypothetical protein PHF33_00585 [Candidatus Delongbacteria bacterium]|nr:hypothetical protein [Candidatus Delongbacteria bacterium]MDD4205582.1 hypothetical protein [Candidatus Delongbacteria bacterium]
MLKGFIPATRKEFDDLNWKRADVIIVTGDAYVDHPYFQVASAGRFLNSNGFKTVILDMPDIDKDDDWKRYGRPSLFFLVITGKEDSMAMNYTAFKKFRSTDPYVPGGKRLNRPDRALIRYCGKIKELYKDVPVLVAGPEAAGRMASHYDYWSDKLRKPVLLDTKADLLLFGDIEYNLLNICGMLKNKKSIENDMRLSGTALIVKDIGQVSNYAQIPSHESLERNLGLLAEHHLVLHKNMNPYNSKTVVQRAVGRYLVINTAQTPLTEEETDSLYKTGFKGRPHPKYKDDIPICRFIKDSILTHRGCLNDVSDSQEIFISGRMISSRSNEEIRKEVIKFIRSKDYNKTVRIFGSPYFNHYAVKPGNRKMCSECERLSCTLPDVCPNIKPQNEEIIKIIEGFDRFPNVRNNFYAGDVDMKLLVKDKEMYKDYLTKRNDGNVQLHVLSFSDRQRVRMGFDGEESAVKDLKFLKKRAGEYGKNLKISADIYAGYPGQTDEETAQNIKQLQELDIELGNVINFIPLPLTLASVLYFTGSDPVSGEQVSVEKKLSVMKKINEWYKKSKKQRK